jgi:transitional endoplasmic reticulum ATPase
MRNNDFFTDTTPESFVYKVKEALGKDTGRAVARMDPDDMKSSGLGPGDVIFITGKRRTSAKVIPCYADQRGKHILQIDGIIRENAQTSIDEKVTIEPAECKEGIRIRLQPDSGFGVQYTGKDARYFGYLLEGLPVMVGDKVRAKLFGSRSVDCWVVETNPIGAVLITSKTKIELSHPKNEEKGSAKVLYEDIGGLGPQVQRIREMIELPLRHPEIFKRLGIEAPKGVFLYGPPGTGKTLIVRAVANETDAYFLYISGPAIMGKFYGESEERLRKVFSEAQANAPAIIFIDEIDAIAPKREDMGSEKQVEKRVVAQLLSLMDGLESRGKVIVIGATNIPNTIDPALRRPGRFDRELAIPVPDKKQRLEILEIHTRGMPLAEDVDLDKLAAVTHGFVGADLEAFAREAAMTALRGIIHEIDYEVEELPYEQLLSLNISMDDFREAKKEIEPSAIREVFLEVPKVTWEEVGGLDEIKEALRETVEWPLKYASLFRKVNTQPPKGILLSGRPGTGKTYMAKALATESGVNFISVKGSQVMSRFLGESEKGIMELFKKARQAAPSILFFDEIDSICPLRGSNNGESNTSDRVISQLLTEMDGIEELSGVFILAATNRIERIDPALLRSGRFELIYELPSPDEQTRQKIFEIHLSSKPLHSDVDLKVFAAMTKDMVGADIYFICQKASFYAIRDAVESLADGEEEYRAEVFVTQKHLLQAAELVIHNSAEKAQQGLRYE